MYEPNLLSIAPPLLAIVLAITTRQVIISLSIGILIGSILFGALASAGTTIQLFSDIPLDLIDVLQGTVMLLATIAVFKFKKDNADR